jgi:hypothetical protein
VREGRSCCRRTEGELGRPCWDLVPHWRGRWSDRGTGVGSVGLGCQDAVGVGQEGDPRFSLASLKPSPGLSSRPRHGPDWGSPSPHQSSRSLKTRSHRVLRLRFSPWVDLLLRPSLGPRSRPRPRPCEQAENLRVCLKQGSALEIEQPTQIQHLCPSITGGRLVH